MTRHTLDGLNAVPHLAHVDAKMAKLDALPWAGGVAFVSCGVRLGVRVDDAAILKRLPFYLPPVREAAATNEVDHLYSLQTRGRARQPPLFEGSRPVRRSRDLDTEMQLDLLRSYLETRIATNTSSWLFVHSGVVEWRGQAILVPGRSRSGKTTLVTALLRAGAKHYSDEFAVLDADGRVHPWARALRVRRPGLSPRSYPVEKFGEQAEQSSLPVGLIVVTEHRAGARWNPRPLTRGQALLALVRNTHVTRMQPDLTIKTLSRAVRRATALASRRGEAAEVAASLLAHPDCVEENRGRMCKGRGAEGRVR